MKKIEKIRYDILYTSFDNGKLEKILGKRIREVTETDKGKLYAIIDKKKFEALIETEFQTSPDTEELVETIVAVYLPTDEIFQ